MKINKNKLLLLLLLDILGIIVASGMIGFGLCGVCSNLVSAWILGLAIATVGVFFVFKIKKTETKKEKSFLTVTSIAVYAVALGIFSCILLSVCFNLYKSGYMDELAFMLLGADLAGVIACLVYVISALWKKLSNLQNAN